MAVVDGETEPKDWRRDGGPAVVGVAGWCWAEVFRGAALGEATAWRRCGKEQIRGSISGGARDVVGSRRSCSLPSSKLVVVGVVEAGGRHRLPQLSE
ncbi:hypothetical protein CASFOL_035136 [Castilleja foliolosa]|uniref:Uncharacterized protein n=1 Tax=Castilleja foliolosa TaxID=1961234 RepID=A0ABD3BSQ1_9LAMI